MLDIEPKKTLSFEKRIQIIAKGIWDGKVIGNKDEPGTIAYECGVTAQTINRDKKTLRFSDMYDTFAVQFMKELSEVVTITDEKGKHPYLALAISEKGRLVRAMMPRRIEAAIIKHMVVQPVFSPSLQSEPPKQVEAEYEEKK